MGRWMIRAVLAATALAGVGSPSAARADFFDDVRRTFQQDIPRTFQHDIPRAFGADRRQPSQPAPTPQRQTAPRRGGAEQPPSRQPPGGR